MTVEFIVHLMTQRDQPYGSARQCCERCGAMLSQPAKCMWTDDPKVWESPPEGHRNCSHAGRKKDWNHDCGDPMCPVNEIQDALQAERQAHEATRDRLQTMTVAHQELTSRLAHAAQEAGKTKESWLRTAADFDNFRKRTESVTRKLAVMLNERDDAISQLAKLSAAYNYDAKQHVAAYDIWKEQIDDALKEVTGDDWSGGRSDVLIDKIRELKAERDALKSDAYTESLRQRAEHAKASADHRALVIGDMTRKLDRAEKVAKIAHNLWVAWTRGRLAANESMWPELQIALQAWDHPKGDIAWLSGCLLCNGTGIAKVSATGEPMPCPVRDESWHKKLEAPK